MTEEIEHLQKLIEEHKKKERDLEIRVAKYGELECPLWITNELERERDALAELKERLAALLREGLVSSTIEAPAFQIKPCNLPPRGEFIGRENEMEQVRQALASRLHLVVIEGIGGIGKTALAKEVAHELWEKGLYDGVIWTEARERQIGLHDIVDEIAHTLNYPYIAQRPPEEKAHEAAKLMRNKKCLLLVDNYETIKDDEAVQGFLLNLPEPSKALLTSREFTLLPAWVISLKGMEQDEALALMRAEGQRQGLESVQRAGDAILLHLYEATGGAPLAIKWAIGQIKQKGQSLDSVLDSLYWARGDPFKFMDRSWEMLSENARHILMTMPIFATSASKEAIEAASEVRTWDLDEGLGQLVEMSLVEVSGRLEEQQRHSVHPLVRAYARAKLEREPDLEEAYHLSAVRYFLSHFAPCAGYRNWLGYQGHPKIARELENLLSLREWCWTRSNWTLVLEFQRLLSRFLDAQETWHQRLQLGQQAVHAAEHLKDDPARLKALLEDMGWTHARLGDYQRAKDLTQEALRIAETLGDTFYIARSYNLLGTISRYERDHAAASQFYQKALETATVGDIDDRRLIASLNADLGCVAYAKGRLDEASQLFEYARGEMEEIGDEVRLARVLCYLGDLASDRGDADRAKSFYEEGLSMAQKTGRLLYVAEALLGLAKVEKRTGNSTQALSRARGAREIYQRLGAERRIEKASQLVEELEQAMMEEDSATDGEN